MDALETRFYLGRCEGRLITGVTTITCRGVGYVGHVYTEYADRGRGAQSALFPAMMADVRAPTGRPTERCVGRSGVGRAGSGRALYLSTGFGSTAYRIYERSGFASRCPNSGEMEWFASGEDAFLEEYFCPAPCHASVVLWDHWPLLNPLTARKGGGVVSYGLHNAFWHPVSSEYLFLTVKHGLECFPGWDARVLMSEAGSAVGLATLVPRWQGDGLRVLDVLLHPAFAVELPAFLAALPLDGGPLVAFAEQADGERVAALEDAGFHVALQAPARCPWTGEPPADRVVLRRGQVVGRWWGGEVAGGGAGQANR